MSTPQQEQIIDTLRQSAVQKLGSALGQAPLLPFQITGPGAFPYYSLNPSNLMPNHLTYGWFQHSLKDGQTPIQLDAANTFVNYYIQTFTNIQYKLSSSDSDALTKAAAAATNQQQALLQSWQTNIGPIPKPATGQPIDAIFNTICNTWAKPATTLQAIKTSRNPALILNNMPASATPFIASLSGYLIALGGASAILSASTLATYLQQGCLANINEPTFADGSKPGNGGVVLDDNTTTLGWNIQPNLNDTLNSLGSTSNNISVTFSVSQASSSEFKVSVNGGAGFSIPFFSFFSLGVKGNASYFKDTMTSSSSSTEITMTFTGPAVVNLSPINFNTVSSYGWYWTQPILDAIANEGKKDVTGYQWITTPPPSVKFAYGGNFSYVQGVAISNFPDIDIKVTSSNAKSINETFQQSVSTTLSFLGIPLASASESTYSNKSEMSSDGQTVTVHLTAPKQVYSTPNAAFTGYVLGVQPVYPGAPTAHNSAALRIKRPELFSTPIVPGHLRELSSLIVAAAKDEDHATKHHNHHKN